ncbi:hypothetical protein [Dyadobacter sp. CY323]|uniref:hypothetical protein n=1 Tax=Dyadobacter sp. CY323 TaxID=2907302 RepID=UPI001F2F64BD|nr:hypothetical protein [Dyadobacter sp. CY323]MCE6992047.1 hypothetical protein [Dyadobacter sp. CY323]
MRQRRLRIYDIGELVNQFVGLVMVFLLVQDTFFMEEKQPVEIAFDLAPTRSFLLDIVLPAHLSSAFWTAQINNPYDQKSADPDNKHR